MAAGKRNFALGSDTYAASRPQEWIVRQREPGNLRERRMLLAIDDWQSKPISWQSILTP